MSEPSVEPGAEMDIEAGKIEPISQWAPTVYETLVEEPDDARPDFEPSEIDENIDEIKHSGGSSGRDSKWRLGRVAARSRGRNAGRGRRGKYGRHQ